MIGMPRLRANFESDLVIQLRQSLTTRWGVQYTRDIDDKNVLIYHFESLRRRVTLRPRTIRIADTFQCPSLERNGWEALQRKIESGGDLGPHLSKRHASLFNRDGLLNEWGVHHFHLGTQPDGTNPRYIQRTGWVILAYVTDDVFYAIDVYPHEPPRWEDEAVIESLHRNWPEAISKYQLRDVQGENLTGQQRRTIRTNNGQATVTVSDGTVYGSIGGPVSGTGTKFGSVMQADMLLCEVRTFQSELENALHTLIPHLQQGGYAGEEEVRAELNGYQAMFPDYHVIVTRLGPGRLYITRSEYA